MKVFMRKKDIMRKLKTKEEVGGRRYEVGSMR